MTPPNEKTYLLPDPEKLVARIKMLNGPALDPTQATGKVSMRNCNLSWVIASGSITITVDSKPFYISYGEIWNSLSELFNGAA